MSEKNGSVFQVVYGSHEIPTVVLEEYETKAEAELALRKMIAGKEELLDFICNHWVREVVGRV